MNSLAESVHRLLSDQIDDLGLSHLYTVQQHSIAGLNGSEFVFAGLKNNVAKLKSYEGLDIAWCEEAQTISKNSWNTLTPTIRKPGSQIICSFNPILDTDFIYEFFVKRPPANARVVRMNYTENPWFGEPLLTEMQQMAITDPDGHQNVWLGYPRQVLDGAIYANEIRAATAANRITDVPMVPGVPVETFWDLGFADSTAIWFAQRVGMEYRVIDYLQGSQHPLGYYIEQLQARGYPYSKHWLPHDAQAKQLGTGRSIEELMRAMGLPVQIVPRLSVADGINALRTLFPVIWWDQAKCADGLNCLRRYRYDKDPDTGQLSRNPLHDDASHGADAARYMAVAVRQPAQFVYIPRNRI